MSAKRFFLCALGVTLGVLLCLTLALAALDPFFVLGGLDEGQPAFFSNERYELAGLIRRQDYSAVVMGTSLAANYRASWFTLGLGKPTLKITFPSGWLEEFDTALDLAFDTHPELDTVYFGLDLQILVRDPAEQDVHLPEYLYNSNPLDDVAYFLNKDSYIQAAKSVWMAHHGQTCLLDGAYVWDTDVIFSRQAALKFYDRPERVAETAPPEPAVEHAAENLAVVESWVEAHPEVHFNIWFSPYSVLYWDEAERTGQTRARLAALEYAWQTLTGYENVTVYSFLGWQEVITNLDFYADTIHCSGAVTLLEANYMMSGRDPVTADNYREKLSWLEEIVTNYDYDGLFEQGEVPPG